MKASTALILGGAGLVVLYVVTRSSSTPILGIGGTTSQPSTLNTALSGLGAILGGFVGSSNGGAQKVFSGPSSGGSTNISPVNSGISPQEVRALDEQNVDDYDAQGSADSPVYGIAGLDY